MRPEDEYNETNKRHTMPHPPDHIPDLDTTPTHKPLKDKKEKDKVHFILFMLILFHLKFNIYERYNMIQHYECI